MGTVTTPPSFSSIRSAFNILGSSTSFYAYRNGGGIVPSTSDYNTVGGGTSGNPLKMSQFAGVTAFVINTHTITGAFTETIPANATTVIIEIWGAGGGGGYNQPSTGGAPWSGGGGGSGGYGRSVAISVVGQAGKTITGNIGGGGQAGTSPTVNGGSGGNTTVASGTFSITSRLTHGGGGGTSGNQQPGTGGAGGGAGNGGAINTVGNSGSNGGDTTTDTAGGPAVAGIYYTAGGGAGGASGGTGGNNGVVTFYYT